jgi:hypothetical protein
MKFEFYILLPNNIYLRLPHWKVILCWHHRGAFLDGPAFIHHTNRPAPAHSRHKKPVPLLPLRPTGWIKTRFRAIVETETETRGEA